MVSPQLVLSTSYNLRGAAGPAPPQQLPYLSELDCENGMRPATDIIHASRSRGTIDVSCLHKFFHITVILYQMFG